VGDQSVSRANDRDALRTFVKRLLDDVWVLETMLREGMVERGVRRIGAEQEFVLVQGAYRPALASIPVLAEIDDPHFTTELAQFNVELNLDPVDLGGDCLGRLHRTLESYTTRLREAARSQDAEAVLVGILPTLRLQDLELASMTPKPRYFALNDALSRLRGEAYDLRIAGTDELLIKHDTVMLEACNTSFQVHLQVDPDRFARAYNVAQVVAAPVLAAAVNSPVLFGRRLWQETRIAVFQQAIDTRSSSYYMQDHSSRVHFGRDWVRRSALELFQEDVTRFPALMGPEDPNLDCPFESLRAGRAPRLQALQLHNSTVYRWNRPCYGISNGKPHLRIENRVLPAGPSTLDEVANAAFWLGLMEGMTEEIEDVSRLMTFADARTNFVAAARRGLGAQLHWLDGRTVPAERLILEELLPLAHVGLEALGIATEDRERFLGVIEGRVRSGRTGARWILDSLGGMEGRGTTSQQLCALVAATIARQGEGLPVHEWPLARLTAGATSFKQAYTRVEQIMTTDVVTVNEEEVVDLVARMMDWHNIRYVPVEDAHHRLVGLVSHRALLRFISRDRSRYEEEQVAVREIMHRLEDDLRTVSPETLTLEALDLMRTHRVGCLPVLKSDRLVGVVTERNFMTIAAQLLEQKLREQD